MVPNSVSFSFPTTPRACFRGGLHLHKYVRNALHQGQDHGVENSKVGVGTGKRFPRNRDLVRLARDTANFQFRIAGPKLEPNGLNLGQSTPMGEQNRQKMTLRQAAWAAHILPEWTLSMNGGTGPRECQSWSHQQAPVLVILGHFWPVLGPGWSGPKPSHSGLRRRNAGGNRALRGAEEGP